MPGVSEKIPMRTAAENMSKSFVLPAVSAEDSVSGTSRKGSDRNNVILHFERFSSYGAREDITIFYPSMCGSIFLIQYGSFPVYS